MESKLLLQIMAAKNSSDIRIRGKPCLLQYLESTQDYWLRVCKPTLMFGFVSLLRYDLIDFDDRILIFQFQRFSTFQRKTWRLTPSEIFHWALVSEKRIKAWSEVFVCFLNSFYTILIRNRSTFQFEVYSRKIETNGQSTSR